ncbi:AraC family transcriptional regulator [Bacillus subtilis]|uniref:AraC family transcriptional regulator n=1 Tax=Bacillus subtilis TaxID=1423 RepID=UPI000988E0AC|nr:AraC family transcriptional regulator [Bacillus subtilis]MBZ6490531.1 AraC family transcriptional regulator [Bacillus subtilis subsp. subtilis]MCS4324878.1 AraC family transcriptional regulator [Bacillus subtilis]MDC6143119.1 AraC family transcriptional regulator [Bacillus subtilis]NQE97734.1 AraC family transcriptional regulator [Bacillus subtilis]OOE17129.1 AraC family transcriptional regulator [Bacillus subtilis]
MSLEVQLQSKEEELTNLVSSFATKEGTNVTSISGLEFIRSVKPLVPVHTMHEPALCIVLQGKKVISMIGEDFFYGKGDYLVVAVDLPVVGEILEASEMEPYLCLRLNFNLMQIAEVSKEYKQHSTNHNATGRGIFVDQTDGVILDALIRLVKLLHTPEDTEILAPLIIKEILYRIMQGKHGHTVKSLVAKGSKLSEVAAALDYLRNHFSQEIKIDALAKKVNLSPSALYHHFKQVTMMTPIQYQRALRLHEARRLIFGKDMRVADAAFQVGYESPSYFNREYRKMFGKPPGKDRKENLNLYNI